MHRSGLKVALDRFKQRVCYHSMACDAGAKQFIRWQNDRSNDWPTDMGDIREYRPDRTRHFAVWLGVWCVMGRRWVQRFWSVDLRDDTSDAGRLPCPLFLGA